MNTNDDVVNFGKLCQKEGIDYSFIQGNDLNIEIEEVDCIFIDTWHVYGQMKRELEKFHSKAKKWIILHDTTIDENIGESIRSGFNISQQMKETGFSYMEIYAGIWPAVLEFLNSHPEFILEKRYTNCNGLTILKRIN